jgi:hypothetical protein
VLLRLCSCGPLWVGAITESKAKTRRVHDGRLEHSACKIMWPPLAYRLLPGFHVVLITGELSLMRICATQFLAS